MLSREREREGEEMKQTRGSSHMFFHSPQPNSLSKFQYGVTNTSPIINSSKSHPPLTLNHIKAAARKLAGALRALHLWQSRGSSNAPEPDVSPFASPLQAKSFAANASCRSKSSRSPKFNFRHSKSCNSPHYPSEQIGAVSFTMDQIYKATSHFSDANRIGEGGCGMVYKGKLSDGSLVAIKRAKKNVHRQQLSLECKNEVLALSKIEHLNLVRLYGFLEHGDERVIVFEYVSNGTLREHLDGVRDTTGIEMAERLDIAIDVAHAVTYLHMYNDPPIIHRDIKASNILITERLRAKVADFGFARLDMEDPEATHISTQIKGTAGYLDPEYLMTYQLTKKSDVFSFGILLVELVTGRRPIEKNKPVNERVTARWAMQKLKKGDVVLVMDSRMQRSPASNMAAERILKLAQECLEPSKQSRPSMKKCAEMLWGIRKDFREKDLPHSPS